MISEEWSVFSSGALQVVARDVSSRISQIAKDKIGAPSVDRLDRLSEWLIETETENEGVAKILRDASKQDVILRDLIANGAISGLIKEIAGGSVELHDVIRLRTVMAHQDFTHSVPHQDLALWPENPNDINAWLSLCEVSAEKAPLCLVRGSSRELRHHDCNSFGQFEVLDFDKDREPIEMFPVSFGDLILFNPATIHFSAPNMTNEVRWSLDFRFTKSGGAGSYDDEDD